jgi:uncharacterized membrane protein (UPF0127 family)
VSRPLLVARNLDRGTVIAERLEDGSSFWSKFMGLMGRPSLPPGDGLWLPGGNSIHMLFMRFAIDIVFVSKPTPGDGRGDTRNGRRDAHDGPDAPRRVVSVRRSLPPWRGVVWYARGAHGAIELPRGTIDATGTAVGDRVTIEPAPAQADTGRATAER